MITAFTFTFAVFYNILDKNFDNIDHKFHKEKI